MKPSERIKEIFGSEKMAIADTKEMISSILQYLDEEYEKKNNPLLTISIDKSN